MANLVNRWAEYNAGTLTPPVVVQRDREAGINYVWVYTTMGGVVGPYSRDTFGANAEAALLALADLVGRPEDQVTCEDGTVLEL